LTRREPEKIRVESSRIFRRLGQHRRHPLRGDDRRTAHGIERADTTARRTAREHFLNELLNEFPVEPIGVAVAFRAGKIDGSLQANGIRIALSDLLIGATALELGFEVVTNNLRHFGKIPGLMVRKL